MNVFSAFDGMSNGQLALQALGIPYKKYFASEIDKFAIQITQKNFPGTIQLGNIENVDAKKLPKIDLLIGGSPCQGLSIGNQYKKGLDDPRSKLFYKFVQLKEELQPSFFFLENVRMDKKSENEFSKLMGVKPIRLDAALFSAARRKRLYWTNIPFKGVLEDRGILFRDILDDNTEGYALSSLLKKRYRKLCDDNGEKLVIGTTALEGKIGNRDRVYGVNHKMATLNASDYKQPKQVLVNGELRKITAIECERCHGIPDNYTEGVSLSQRYKMIGNGWDVHTIIELFKGLLKTKQDE